MRRGSGWTRSRAFSLIELLVVTAIIGALGALLLPVMSQARARARQGGCANNLRQLGMAIQLYVDDWREVLPRPAAQPDEQASWFHVINPYLGKGGTAGGVSAAQKLALVKQDPIWATFDSGARTNWRTIKMNRKLIGTSAQGVVSVSDAVPAWRNLGGVPRPVTTPLLADSTVERTASPVYKQNYEGWEPHVELRHVQGANILFVDGHVQFWATGTPQSSGVGWSSGSTTLDWWTE